MPEREPFNDVAAETILGSQADPVHDDTHGEGERFTTGDGQTEVEVFPSAVRVTITLTGPPQAVYWPGGSLGFRDTASGRTLAVRDTGEVVYRDSQPAAEPAEDRRQALEEPAPPPHADAADQDQAAEPATERGKLVEFTGRIGRRPNVFGAEDKVRVKLAVAEHVPADDGEKTVWHEVWTSDKLGPKVAQQVEERTLRQGVEVAVKGFQHKHPDRPDRPGREFVRAFLITPVQRPRPR